MDKLSEYYIYKTKVGLENKLSKLIYKVDRQAYFDRLDFENKVILQMGYPGYFLVVQDFINWAKSKGILVGPGRGSGAGALACFALSITNVDPIPYGLIFERFLNPARVSMPDLDIDFPKKSRDLVIEYVRDRYGDDKVAQIGTFGTYKAKAAIKAVAKTLGLPLALSNRLTALYPKPKAGKEVATKEAFAHGQLKEIYESDTEEGTVLRWASKFEDRISSFGVHASGVVIANEPLTDTLPLAINKKGQLVTQWEMNNVEDVGLIKFDFLGLKNLDVISTALKLIKEQHNIDIDIENITLEDEATYAALRKGDTVGVFQLESSSGIRDLLVKIRPTCIEDITALVAMYRPGPLASPKKDDYLAWRAGEKEPTYHHPNLEKVLKETGGWLVYQEQAIRIAKELAGYSMAEADLLRRAIGKKKDKEMKENFEKFTEGMVKNGYTQDLANILWEEIKAFSDYGFNKSHAFAYAMISYWCSYLKTHYPLEFMAALLTHDIGNQDQMIIYLQECKRLNINVYPPNINRSTSNFEPYNGGILFGFSSIKNLGEGSISSILEIRNQGGPFRDFYDFITRLNEISINNKDVNALVLSGSMDCFVEKSRTTSRPINRNTLLQAYQGAALYKKDLVAYEKKILSYHQQVQKYEERETAIKRGDLSAKGKKLNSLKVPEFPEKPKEPELIILPELAEQFLLSKERELTGSFITGNPLDKYESQIAKLNSNIRMIKETQPDNITFIGMVTKIQIKETKNKNRFAYLILEDLSGTLEAVIWVKEYSKYKDYLIENLPMKISGNLKYIEAEPDEDDVVDQVIASLEVKSILLLEQLEKEENVVDLNLPLNISILNNAKRLLNKYSGDDGIANINFVSHNHVIKTKRVFGINKNGRTLRAEVERITK